MKIFRDGLEEIVDGPIKVSRTREGHVVESYTVGGVKKFFVTLNNTHWCSHGSSVAEAVADALWKDPKQRPDKEKLVADIKAAGRNRKISLAEFRLLTGACADGCRVALARAKVTGAPMTAFDIRDKVSLEWGLKLISILGWDK